MALNYKSSLVRYRRYLAAAEADPVWKASLFVILSLILLLFMILFAIRPTVITIAGLIANIKEQKILSARLADKIDTVRDASDLLSQQKENITLLDQALPASPEWSGWVDAVQKIAESSGVEVMNVLAGPVMVSGRQIVLPNDRLATQVVNPAPKEVTPIHFSIIAKGDYGTVKDFAEQLEGLRRLAIITNIDVTKTKDGSIETTITGVIGYMMEAVQP